MSKIDTQEGNQFSKSKKYIRKKRHPYKLYIPENLDMDAILSENPPDFKYQRDNFIYIVHLISSIPTWKKDFDIVKYRGFTPVHKLYLSSRIHNYRPYIDYLKQQGVVIEGTSYMPGHYACGLKFTERYRTKVKGCYITKNTLIKSIMESSHNRDIEAEKRLPFLKDWFNSNLTIDMEAVKSYLDGEAEKEKADMFEMKRLGKVKKDSSLSIDELATHRYNMRLIPADKINDGRGYRLKIDNTSGRFHSPLTNLKKELKQYLKHNGETLYGIDIVNSQPLLSLVVLDYDLFIKNGIYKIIAHYNEKFKGLAEYPELSDTSHSLSTMLVELIKDCHKAADVQIFRKSVIEGSFYEQFANLLKENFLLPEDVLGDRIKERKYAKRAIFTAFFSKQKSVIWNKEIQAFKQCFPTVFEIFNLIKSGKGNHATLALLLQRVESNLVLHNICYDINKAYPESPLFTIHDSIASTSENIFNFRNIFERHLFEKLGEVPKLMVEKW
ncbi:MAG: hypothetical protein QM727_12580 [Niabella sp.]